MDELPLPPASARRPTAGEAYDDSTARTAPLTQVYNFPSLSWGSNGNFYTTHRSREIRNDLTISLGRHTWKAGGDFQSLSFEGDNRPAIGTWTFRTDQPFDPTNRSVCPGTRFGAAVHG